MATSNNTIKTRIQLKSDTEENWIKAGPKDGTTGFVPLRGELIIYSADETHAFSRLKIGDGTTNVVALPFIDSGTLNGQSEFISKYQTYGAFPQPGSPDKLYVDLSSGQIYHYTGAKGYSLLNNFTLEVTKATVREVTYWGAGRAATASTENNILILQNGIAPELLTQNTSVVTDVIIGGND